MFDLNHTGQAYSTFQLLIAAIVAVAILYILMSILGIIPNLGGDIVTTTKNMIQKQADSPGSLERSAAVGFNPGSNLAPSTLIGNSGLSSDQVCINKGDFATNDKLVIHGKSLMNDGSTAVQVKVSVTCNYSKDLINSLEEIGFQDVADTINDGETGVCDCPLDEDSNKKCCVVILKYA